MRLRVLVVALLLAAFNAGRAQQPGAVALPDVSDLPLIEIQPTAAPTKTFAIFLTGDGGWATLDRGVTRELSSHGIAVVAVNMRAYLWRRRTPDESGSDLIRLIRHYSTAWGKNHVAIIGYSRGADVAPFMVSRLTVDTRRLVSLVALLGFSKTTNFQFHFKDIIVESHRRGDLNTLPELEGLRGMNLLCVYGTDEKDSGCRDAPAGLMKLVTRPGGHHFDNDFKAIGDIVLDALPDE
jgi:type IV secretory pathway VirJ component